MKRILFLAAGGSNSTSQMRGRALQRCGHVVKILDLRQVLTPGRWAQHWHRMTGYALLQQRVEANIRAATSGETYDLVWVDSGYLVGPRVITFLRSLAPRIVNYNNDDPTGRRDGNSWFSFRRAIPEYDLLVAVREITANELRDHGARRVCRVFMGYDEVAHAPLALDAGEISRWANEVLFVGTWMPERGPFMVSLLAAGVPVSIYGDRWSKAAEWLSIRKAWKGPALYGTDYVKAIQASKITLGLLSKGNRDQNTQRSAEIPAIGGLLCAERTPEHLQMFKENTEAVFWDDAAECAERCRELLANEERRQDIARAGQRRVRELGLGNETVMNGIVAKLLVTEGSEA